MTEINQNYNNNYAVQGQRRAMPPQMVQQKPIPVKIPSYYLPDNKPMSFKEALEENPVYSMGIKAFFGPLIDHPIASLATWLGCGYLLDRYSEACGGEYKKSLVNKIASFGDKIQNSNFVQSKPSQTVLSWFNRGSKQGAKLTDKVELFRAMKETPSRPEWEMVTSEMLNQRQRIVHDFTQIGDALHLGDEEVARLHKLGLTNKEKEMLKDVFKVKNISDIPEAKASVQVQLSRLGKTQDEINGILKHADSGVSATKDAILKAMGRDKEWYKKIKSDTVGLAENIKEVEEAAGKVGGKVKIGLGKFKPLGINLGFLTKPIERTMGFDSVHNRLHSLREGVHTATGRFLSKFVQMTHRGLTFGGGKIGVLLFVAPALVEAAVNTKKAEKDQKVGTAVSTVVNHISWVFTFPLALKMMHTFGGAQYAGLSKEQVGKIRNIRDKFNENNKKGLYAEKSVYKDALKKAKEDIEKVAKNPAKKTGFLTKCVSKLARFMTMDLGRFDGRNTGNFVTKQFTKLKNLPRNLLGVPMRFVIFGLLSMGLLDSIINKGIKLVFGESYDYMKDEERKDAKKEQKKFTKEDLNQRIMQTAIKQQQNVDQKVSNTQKYGNAMAAHGRDMNSTSIPQVQKEKVDNYTYIPSQNNTIASQTKAEKRDNYTYIPSQNCNVKSEKEENKNKRSYIPSQAAANIKNEYDNSGLQSALDRASKAEANALKILAGNFEGM